MLAVLWAGGGQSSQLWVGLCGRGVVIGGFFGMGLPAWCFLPYDGQGPV